MILKDAPGLPDRATKLITTDLLQSLSAKWLFPGLLIAMVAGNQLWKLGPFYIGQMFSWINAAAAVIIVLSAFRRKLWPRMLLGGIIIAKVIQVTSLISPDKAELVFDLLLNALFCAAGAMILFRRLDLIYKQVMVICLLNVIFMAMQVGGVGEWTQFLATEMEFTSKTPARVFFVKEEDLDYQIVQARPSGLLHSSNFLSIVALFGLSLHLSRSNKKFHGGTAILAAMAVLSMAKVVLFGFLLIVLWLLMTGNRLQRKGAVRAVVWAMLFLGIYAVLFPGLFAHHINIWNFSVSFFGRLGDVARSFAEGNTFRVIVENYFADTDFQYFLAKEEHISGYAPLVPYLPYIIIFLALLTPFFLRGLRNLRRCSSLLSSTSVVVLFVVLIYPFAVPFLRAQIFGFIAGFALLPLFISFQPRFFKASQLMNSVSS